MPVAAFCDFREAIDECGIFYSLITLLETSIAVSFEKVLLTAFRFKNDLTIMGLSQDLASESQTLEQTSHPPTGKYG